jgi:transcriptional repressor NrdR
LSICAISYKLNHFRLVLSESSPLRCPRCDSAKTRVVDSREGVDGRSVRRRRACESCEFRFTTFERLEESLPMVVKKGGQRESFDRYKILSGMKKACEKRPVSVLQLEDAVKGIESKILESGEKEISSGRIGELVIDALRDIDQVAYVRFASVYREFSDISEFVETLRQLGQNAPKAQALPNVYQFPAGGGARTNPAPYREKAERQRQQELGFGEKKGNED